MKPLFEPQITIPQWLELPMNVRLKLKKIFNIPKSTGCEVHNNIVVSDGHTHKDLAHVTLQKMQAYTGSTSTDFYELLNNTINIVYNDYQKEINNKMEEELEMQDTLNREKIEAIKEYTREISSSLGELGQTITQPVKRRGRPRKYNL